MAGMKECKECKDLFFVPADDTPDVCGECLVCPMCEYKEGFTLYSPYLICNHCGHSASNKETLETEVEYYWKGKRNEQK